MDHGSEMISSPTSKTDISANDSATTSSLVTTYVNVPMLPPIMSQTQFCSSLIPSGAMVGISLEDRTKKNCFHNPLPTPPTLVNNGGILSDELIGTQKSDSAMRCLTTMPSAFPSISEESSTSILNSPSKCTAVFPTHSLPSILQPAVVMNATISSNINFTKVSATRSSQSPLKMENIENIFISNLNGHAGRKFDHNISALSFPCHSTTSPMANKILKTKCKLKSQALWSALITNLGICVLLLVYTLLGSLIFLTIENDDKSTPYRLDQNNQKRVLASAGYASRTSYDGHNNTKKSQIIVDNSTTTVLPAIFPLSASPAFTISSSVSDGIVSVENQSDVNNNLIKRAMMESSQPSSPDTYDARQRTIENIWDITVSLNILYKENWTKLAALEISKFQDQLLKKLNEEILQQFSNELRNEGPGGENKEISFNPTTKAVLLHTFNQYNQTQGRHEWNFAKAFLFSLTILTTTGCGNIAPRTTLGRLVTLIYALFGIPLTLVYLSSTGGILAKISREVFSKALCCCLCSNCGYCCYDEKRMAAKERRMKQKRQLKELYTQHQEPFYVRSAFMHDSVQPLEDQQRFRIPTDMGSLPEIDSVAASDSSNSVHGLSMLAPIVLCFSMVIIYIMFGALVLYKLENWPLLDGIYFCFMSLSTIGFGDMLPEQQSELTEASTTTWFCSVYIMTGMALTAMCFNVMHDEIVHRIKIVVEVNRNATACDVTVDDPEKFSLPP